MVDTEFSKMTDRKPIYLMLPNVFMLWIPSGELPPLQLSAGTGSISLHKAIAQYLISRAHRNLLCNIINIL